MSLRAQVASILRKNGRLRPNKKLGQNFMIDRSVVNRVVEASGVGEGDVVLEVIGIPRLTPAQQCALQA